MNPVILIGRRLDYRLRDAHWLWVRDRWEETLPDVPIVEGHHYGGPFSKAAALNRAAHDAAELLDWNVCLYVDADFVLEAPQGVRARDAMLGALHHGQLVFPHNQTVLLTEDGTHSLFSADDDPDDDMRLSNAAHGEHRHTNTYSGIAAVPRSLWDAVGGYDERFVGWGWEDLAFWASCCAIGGGFQRMRGELYHLWHRRTRADNEDNPNHPANMVLGQRYLAAKDNAAAMRQILEGRNG